jgi:hypothetical protein
MPALPLLPPTTLINGLVANDKLTFNSAAEAAAAFSKVFSEYFGGVITPPLTPGSNINPLAVAALTAGLTTAFSAKDPATLCSLMHTAIAVNYIGAFAATGPLPMFIGSSLVTAATPLAASLVPAMSALQSETVPAKTVLAATIAAWVCTITVTIGTTVIKIS